MTYVSLKWHFSLRWEPWLSTTSTIVALCVLMPGAAMAQATIPLPRSQFMTLHTQPSHTPQLLAALPSPPTQGTPIARGSGGSYFSLPSPPPNGAPGSNGSGASRGACILGKTTLLALAPTYRQEQNGKTKNQVWGLTTQERPTLWFSVPPTEATAALEFVLRDEANQILYRQPVQTLRNASIISIPLQALPQPLEVGKMYQWLFKIKCADSMQPPVYVNGWIQRTQLEESIATQIEQANPLQKAALYAQHGIWYDAVTTLATLTSAQAQLDWRSLLTAAKLDDLASLPVIAPPPPK